MSETASVRGITREQFNIWKHDPVSKLVLQFLRDKREFLIRAAAEQWLNGSESFASINQTVRGQIIELGEIVELPFEAVEGFYKEQEEDNGPEPEGSER